MENYTGSDQQNNENLNEKKAGNKKYLLLIVIILLIILLIFLLARSCSKTNENGQSDANSSITGSSDIVSQNISGNASEATSTSMGTPEVGSLYGFGEYEQDAIETNGKEPIQWLILDVTEDAVLLLSEKTLDCVLYQQIAEPVTWETSYIRGWLNDDFLNSAFSTEEAAKLLDTTVVNNDNPDYGTAGGNDTVDRVFLLSTDEVLQYLGEDDRLALNTQYAITQGAYNAGYGVWWLRSPGVHDRAALTVSYDGSMSKSGTGVEQDINSVRPAIWISLNPND